MRRLPAASLLEHTLSEILSGTHMKHILGRSQGVDRHVCVRPLSALPSPPPGRGGGAPSRSGQDSLPSPSHPSHHHQHQNYHAISKQWQVKRPPFKDYPLLQQEAIRNNIRRRTSPKPLNPEDAERAAAAAQVQKLQTVLVYEQQHGLANFRGQSGETFASWTQRAFSALAPELATLDAGAAQRCSELAYRMESYAELPGIEQRRTLVAEAAAVAALALKTLQQGPAAPAASSTSAVAAPAVDEVAELDAEAAEAHAEETVPGLADSAAPLQAAPPAAAAVQSIGDYVTSAAIASPSSLPDAAAAPPELPEGYVLVGGRRVKAETAAFRRSFLEAALSAAEAAAAHSVADLAGGEQRTAQWVGLRERRLTASAFAKALGFFRGDRTSLWEEKIGIREPFKGNDATRWGTRSEPAALAAYQALTGQDVENCMFQVKHDDGPHGWLGASPDGLIGGLVIQQQQQQRDGINSSADSVRGMDTPAAAAAAAAGGLVQGDGPGILEVKCPYNKGRPELAVPPRHAIWYYMPQVQGLMEIFGREWCNLYIWTPAHGSAAFHIRRDRAYWAACFDVLAEFWWAHVVPARQAHNRGADVAELRALAPSEQHPDGKELEAWSKRLAMAAPATFFPPPPGEAASPREG